MKDVAKLAGVSISTVSHVINQKNTVSEIIKTRVNEAALQLNYITARNKRSGLLGMIVTTSSSPFYAEMIQHIEQCCFEIGYQLLVCTTKNSNEILREQLNMLLNKSVDGLIMIGTEGHDIPWYLFPKKNALPIVMMDWTPTLDYCDLIKDNSFFGAKLATEYLIKQGYQKIACILGPENYVQSRLRQEGYRYAMQEAHLIIPELYEIRGEFDYQSGKICGLTLLQLPDPPKAIFATNDAMAIGVYQAIHQMGLTVGQDVAVIGYDDLDVSQFLVPALTTIHQPKSELGKTAVDMIVSRINDKNCELCILEVTPYLIERDSTPPSRDLY